MLIWRSCSEDDSIGPFVTCTVMNCPSVTSLLSSMDPPAPRRASPVCSLLSKVGEMPYNPKFKALPGGEDLIELSEEVVNNMSTDQSVCYKLVVAVKQGELPPALLNMKCGSLNHARYSGTLTLSLFDQYFGSL